MLLPFDIGEILGALELAHKVIEIGWSSAHDAHQQYIEFKGDIEALAENLNTLHLEITISRASSNSLLIPRRASTTPNQLSQVFGSFKETLEDCRRLLERQARYGTNQGPVYNIRWFLLVEDEVNMLRDRIAFLNIKLSIALKSLEIETSNGTRFLMREYTDLVLYRIQLAESHISRLLGEPEPTETPRRLDVPQSLEDILVSITATRYGSLANITIAQGVDETIFYLDRATKWYSRRQLTENRQAFKLANIFRAYWTLQATKEGDEYRTASTTVSVEEFERHFPRLGMTTRRFFNQLEERVLEAYAQLSQEAGIVSLTQLQAIIERDRDAWEEHGQWKPKQEDDDDPRKGERVAICRLQNANTATEQHVEIYQQGTDERHLTLITCGTGRADRVHQVDLASLHLAPSIEAVDPKNDFYSVTLGSVTTRAQGGFSLSFYGKGDLFEFQRLMTGYKVVDDYSGTTVTSQRANKFIGGERRTETCRVQLWSSTAQPTGATLPKEFLDKATGHDIRNLPARTVSPNPPTLSPLPSFSRLSLALSPSRNSAPSIMLGAQATPRRYSQASTTLTRFSTATSFTSRSSDSSLGTPSTRSATVMQVDNRGNVGCVLNLPDPPRLVVFVPGTQAQAQAQTTKPLDHRPASLLVINLDQHVRINPSLCDCSQPHTTLATQPLNSTSLTRSSSTTTAIWTPLRQSQPQLPQPSQPGLCKRMILQGINGASIRARETDTTNTGTAGGNTNNMNWNLAGAGRYQHGQGLARVKRLKMVTVEFASVDERVRFVEFFEGLRRLYLMDLRGHGSG